MFNDNEVISEEVIGILYWAGTQGFNSSRIKRAIEEVKRLQADSKKLYELSSLSDAGEGDLTG